jgi:membrane-associated phospholipid phosphatase
LVGQTGVSAKIVLAWPTDIAKQSIATTADANGQFQLVVPVGNGVHRVRLTATDDLGRKIHSTQEIRKGDIIADWNAAALNVVRGWTTTSNDPYEGRIVPSQPPMVARNLAMIQTAMFDAINAVSGAYHGYALDIVPQTEVSTIAAAATAAYDVASSIYTAAKERAIWDASLAESLATVPDGDAKTQGIALGKQAATAMLARRANDLRDAVPGHWNRTEPDDLPPLLPQWPSLKPFILTSGSQFRPEAPPSLGSAEYAQAVDQVMSLGSVNSATRTSEQTQIAIFWADGAGTATPPGHWNRIATDVLLERGDSLLENARTMALLNLAMADAGIASWDAKYHYDLWRPIDAIREADQDGNASTIADPTWIPLLKTPPFPAYTSGHSTFSGAAASVLTALLGDNVSFTSSIDPQNAPSQRPLAEDQLFSRQFTSFNQAAAEAGMSRIYGGIHFDFDNVAGREAGTQVAQYVLSEGLRNRI